MKYVTRSALGLSALVAATASHAALDVTAAVTEIGLIPAALATVFGALVVVYAASKGYRFVLGFIGK